MSTTETMTEETGDEMPADMLGTDAEETETETPTARKRERKFPRPRSAERSSAISPVFKGMETEEHLNIRQWMEAVSGGAPDVKVSLERQEPDRFKGVKTNGLIGSYTRLIDEDEINRTHGGGKYQIRVYTRDAKGRMAYQKSRNIEIAGDPKLDGLRSEPEEKKGNDGTNDRLLDFAMKATQPRGTDYEAIKMFTEPLKEELAESRRQVREAREEARHAVPVAPPRNIIEEKMIASLLEGDSARLVSMRTQHESEIRTLKENHREDEKRMQDRFDRELDYARKSKDNEIAALKMSMDGQVQAEKTKFDMTKIILESRIKDLESDLKEVRAELITLRAKKEKSPAEMVKDMKDLKELFEDGEDPKEEKSKLEKFAESPMAGAIIEKVGAMFSPAPPPPPVPSGPPVGVPYRLEDGRIAVRDAAGNIHVKRPKPKPPEAAPAPAPVAGAIEPNDLKMAALYLESAQRNNTPIEDIVLSAKTVMSAGQINALRAVGVDGFLDQVAQSQLSPSLISQAGRNYCRKVFRSLMGEDDKPE